MENETITLTALAVLLAPYLKEAGKTLATETIKLALEKRGDIKDAFVELFKPNEITTLGLNEQQTPENIKKLQQENPEITKEVQKKIEENRELLEELANFLSKQEGRTINTKTYIENASDFTINQ